MAALRWMAIVGVSAMLASLVLAGCGGVPASPLRFAAAWNGLGTPVGGISYPEGLGVSPNGRLLVADTWNDRILLCDDEGRPVAAFGKNGQAKGELLRPRSVTTDGRGNIYVVDCWNQRVQKFSPEGRFMMTFGQQGAPLGYDEGPGKWVYPHSAAVDSNGNIYVSDFNNNRVHKFNAMGKFVMMWGIQGRQDGQFSHPSGLAIDKQDRLYVADLGNNRVQRFTFNQKGAAVFDGKWGEQGADPGQFDRPYGVCVDGDGNLYVADFGNHRIQVFSPSGKLLYMMGKRGSGDGELDCPLGVAVDGKGAVYVLDWGNNRVQKFTVGS